MTKLLPVLFFLYSYFIGNAQQNILEFKKGNRTVEQFWKGKFIAFQLKDKEWQKGEITRIQHDSFYIRPRVIKFSLMNTDTFYFPVLGFSFSDVYAMPKKGYLIDYIDGRFQISRSGGRVRLY